MSPPRDGLNPPKDDLFTTEQLKNYGGSNPEQSIHVSIKGTIFDVTRKADMYGPGKSYNIFAGKDGSRGLALPSLKPEHAIADYSDLSDRQLKVLMIGIVSSPRDIISLILPRLHLLQASLLLP